MDLVTAYFLGLIVGIVLTLAFQQMFKSLNKLK